VQGKLVMQAYTNLDSATAAWMSGRLVEAAMQDMQAQGPGEEPCCYAACPFGIRSTGYMPIPQGWSSADEVLKFLNFFI